MTDSDTDNRVSASAAGVLARVDRSASQTNLLAVYLFNGDDDLKRETMLKRLSARIAETGDPMLNISTHAAENLKDIDQLTDIINTPPFAGLYRLVVINNVEKLGRDLSETVIEYLKNPVETTVLALVADRLAANTRLYKAISGYDKKAVVDVSSVKRSELPHRVCDLAKNHRVNMSVDAARSLIDRIGTSMVALNNEIRRLSGWALAAGKQELTVSDIIEQVPALIEPKPWELADAICQRNAKSALKMLDQMHSSSPSAIFLHCLARLREVLSIVAMTNRGISSSAEIAAVLKKQEWQIRSSIQAAKRFTETELAEVIKNAWSIEAAMKSGEDSEQLLVLWLADICTGRQAGTGLV
jgi:DNA polymerase-3 subunit delta